MSINRNVGKVACVHCGQEYAKTGIKKHEENCKLNPANIDKSDDDFEEEEFEENDDSEEEDLEDSDEDESDEDADEEDESDENEEESEEKAEQENSQDEFQVLCLKRFSFFWMGQNMAMLSGQVGKLPAEFARDMSRKGYVEIQY